MKVRECDLNGILILEPNRYQDRRGHFLESYQHDRYKKYGISEYFVQDNLSRSYKNILRGMHFTQKRSQSQLLTIIRGCIYDVVVDIRIDSETYGKWFGIQLSEDDGPSQIYMPNGFAHGFCVLSDVADLHYKVSEKYDPKDDFGLVWSDSQIRIKWPIENPIVSEKDMKNMKFADLHDMQK